MKSWEEIRQDFPILKREIYNKPLVYFDNAASTQKPAVVIDDPEIVDDVSEVEFKDLVDKEAYFISLNQLSYDELCWLLAERTLSLSKGYENVSQDEIRELAKNINGAGSSYDELCWLNAEMQILHRKF